MKKICIVFTVILLINVLGNAILPDANVAANKDGIKYGAITILPTMGYHWKITSSNALEASVTYYPGNSRASSLLTGFRSKNLIYQSKFDHTYLAINIGGFQKLTETYRSDSNAFIPELSLVMQKEYSDKSCLRSSFGLPWIFTNEFVWKSADHKSEFALGLLCLFVPFFSVQYTI